MLYSGNGTRHSGFYYDEQKNNPLTRVILQPSTELKAKWEKYSGQADEDIAAYRRAPILESIVSEDFTVTVANNWSNFGGDPIGALWDGAKPLAPYIGKAAETLGNISDQAAEFKKDWDTNKYDHRAQAAANKILSFLPGVLRSGANSMSTYSAMLNRTLLTQGTRFTYYSGSNVSYGGLVMTAIFFTDHEGGAEEKIGELYKYVIGHLIPVTDDPNVAIPVADWIGKYAFWQVAPGGYQPDMCDVDQAQFGTLRLRVGAFYSIESLLVENAIFKYSKQMAKDPRDGMEGEVHPAFIEVTLNLRPASKFSDASLQKFAHGSGAKNYRDVNVKQVIQGVITPLGSGKVSGSNPSSIMGNNDITTKALNIKLR